MPPTRPSLLPRDRLFLAGGPRIIQHDQSAHVAGAVAGVVAAWGLWNEASRRRELDESLSRRSWRLVGVEMTADVRGDEDSASNLTVLQSLPDQTLVFLQLVSRDRHDKPSAPRALPTAAAVVTAFARAAPHLTIVLDHRVGNWLCRVEDAVRLLMRIYCPNVGVALNLTDWQAADGDMGRLGDVVRLALPKLRAVSMAVPEELPTEEMIASPPQVLLDALRHPQLAGYTGPVVLRRP